MFGKGLIPALAGLTACGAVVADDYRGEVLFRLEGDIAANDAVQGVSYGVVLRWAYDTAETRRTQSVDVTTAFPARYAVDVFQPPPQGVRIRASSGVQMAVAQPLLFEDTNDDGEWSVGEPIVGGAVDRAVVWLSQASDRHAQGFGVYQVTGSPCEQGTPALAALIPTDADRADLLLGSLFGLYIDWDCNGQGNEFADASPLCDNGLDLADVCTEHTLDPTYRELVQPNSPEQECLAQTCASAICLDQDPGESTCSESFDPDMLSALGIDGYCVLAQCEAYYP